MEKKLRVMLAALLFAVLMLALCGAASAENLFSLSKTGTVEESWYRPRGTSGDYLLESYLRNGYCGINSYDSSLGEPQWTLTQTSGSENILQIADGRINDSEIYVEFGVAYPPLGDYEYTLSCEWQGETQSVDYVVHIAEADFPSSLSVGGLVEIPLNGTAEVTPKLDPEGWSLPGETASWTCYVYIGSNIWEMGSADTLSATVEDGTFTFTGKVPGYYRVEYRYRCANIYRSTYGYVVVLNEDSSRPEFDFSLSPAEDLNISVYDKNSISEGTSINGIYINHNVYGAGVECEWQLTWISGPADIGRIYHYYSNDCRIQYATDDVPNGTYVYDISCTIFGTTKSRRVTITVADPPMGSLNGISVPDLVEVPLNGTAEVTLALDPEGWYIQGETPNIYCYVYDGNDVGFTNGNESFLKAEIENDTFTFTGAKTGYYRVQYCYDCAGFYKSVSSYAVVLNEDGSRPEFAFTINKNTDRETFYLNENTEYNGDSMGGFGVSSGIYISNKDVTWTLTQKSGPMDAVTTHIDSWSGTGSLMWKVDRPAVGTYEYELSCTALGTTKTETIRFAVAELPMGSLNGMTVPDMVEVPLNGTATVTPVLNPEGWYIPDETPNVYCYIDGNYNGNENFLKAEVENGTFTFTGAEAGYYRVEYCFDCGGFFVGASGEVVVMNEDGTYPEYDFSLNQEDLVTTFYIQDNYGYYQKDVPNAYTSISSSLDYQNAVWTLTKISGDADILQFEGTSENYYRYVEFNQTPLTPGTYEYDVSCTIRGTTRTRHITLTIAYPPNGPLEGLTKSGDLTLRAGETGTVQIGKVPADWTLPGETERWYCQVMGQGYGWSYNGIYDYLTAEVDQETGTFTFTAIEPGYYTVMYYYSCGNFGVSVTGEVTVLNEDGTYPEYDFSLNEEDLVTTFYIQDNYNYYQQELPYGYTSLWNYTGDEDTVWTLTKTSGDADILQFEQTSANHYRRVIFSQESLTPGTYEYDVSCTIRGTTRTRHITLTIAYPPNGPLEGLTKSGDLTLRIGETGTVQLGKLPADWTLPGETEEWYCNVKGNQSNWWYNGIANALTVEVDQETGAFTFTAIKPGRYTVSYQYNCSNFGSSVTGEVIVLNEDGSVPEFDFSLIYTAERTEYRVSPYMQNYDVSNGYIRIENYVNHEGKPVDWTLRFISGPEDAISFYPYQYSEQYSYDGYLRWQVNEPAAGDYVYEIACTWMDTTRTATVTVHLQESPNGYLNGVDVPEEISVRAGESATYTGRLNPEGWSIPGYDGSWRAELYDGNDSWMSLQNKYVTVSIDQETGVYTFTGLIPGYYRVYIGYVVDGANVYEGESIPLIVLNEDGSVPPFTFSLGYRNREVNYYLTPDGKNMQSYVNGAHNWINNYIYGEDEAEWTFTLVSGSSDSFYVASHNMGGSVDLYARGIPAEGDYVYRLTCAWRGGEATADYTIHVKPINQAINGILGDAELRVMPNATATEVTFTLDPADWSIDDESAYLSWVIYFREPGEDYYTANSTYFQATNSGNNGTFSVKGYVPGIYRGYVMFQVGNIQLQKNLKLIVLNEDSTEPEEALNLVWWLNYSTLNIDPERTSYINHTIAGLRLEEYDEEEIQDNQPIWTIQAPEGQESLYALRTYDYGSHINVYFAEEPQEEGTYTFTVTCTWNEKSESHTFEYTVQRFIAPDSVTCDMKSAYALRVGDTITLNKPEVTPSDWSWNGQKAVTSYSWYLDENGESTSAITLVSEDADSVTLSVSQAGSYRFQYNVRYGSYSNNFFTSLIVLDEDGTIDLPVQSSGRGSEENPQYLRLEENWIGYVYISNYSAYASMLEGEPQLTYTTEPADADIRIETWQSGTSWEKGFYFTPAVEEDQQVTVNWTVTWGNVSKSGSITAWWKIPGMGILKGISLDCGDELTVAAGTPVTIHATTDPVGWKADGSETAPTLQVYADLDEDIFEVVEVGELYATIRFDEPGWYTFDAEVEGSGSYQWQNVVAKVTDASGNLADPEDIVFDFSGMRETYPLGQNVYQDFEWKNNVGVDELTMGWTLNGNAFEPIWNWEDEAGEYFVPTETGTYQVTITLKDKLGRTATGTYSFQVTDPEPLSFTGITVEGTEEGLLVSLQTEGGLSNPSYRIDLYRSVNNGVRAGLRYDAARTTFSGLADGLYQVVATVSDSETSITRATGFYRVIGGNVSAVSGTMKLPGGLKEIEAEAFQGITSASVICPNGMTTIGANAFSGSTVTRIEIPTSVTSISNNAFSGATRYLTVVTTAGSQAENWARANGYFVEYK